MTLIRKDWNCVDKRNIYRLHRHFCDLYCGNLGQAICNGRHNRWWMFVAMPTRKCTLFVPAVEQYKWFHAWGSGICSLSWDFFPLYHPFFLLNLLFSATSCCAVNTNISNVSFLILPPSTRVILSAHTHFPFYPYCVCHFSKTSARPPLSLSLCCPFPPFALSITPTSRCSVRCLLHSASGLARKTLWTRQNARAVPDPSTNTTVASGHNEQTTHKHHWGTLLFCCCWPTLSGTLQP